MRVRVVSSSSQSIVNANSASIGSSMKTHEIPVHRFSGKRLVREGVTDVFGYPGGAILPAYDAMLQYPIRHVLVRHEQGATHMADGYARATGKVGVAIATSGPGATNMVTGIATAMMDSSPIVCITGQVGSKLIGSDAFQETDITGITLPITKHNYLVTCAGGRRAGGARGLCRRARRPPGPGAGRHHQGRAAGQLRVRLGRRRARISRKRTTMRCRATAIVRDAIELINAAEAPADSRRPRRDAVERGAPDRSRSPSARRFRSPSRCSASAASPPRIR